jgi:peptidoglycan/LPS O-acetylase OafA/YrhL
MSFKQMLTLKLESDRMIYLDLLRIASSYMIIVYHFQQQLAVGQAAGALRARLEGFMLAVDLFFFISGFVIASVYTGRIAGFADFREFMVKRIARLVPLHWATFAVFAVFGILYAAGLRSSNHPEIYAWPCAIPNALLLHAFGFCSSLTFNYVSWSISAEMGMYLLFPLLAVIVARRWLALPLALAVIAVLTWVSERSGWSWLEWTFDGGVLRALPTFLLGMIAFQHRARLGRLPWAAGWLGLACLAFLAGCMMAWPKLWLLPIVYAVALLGIAASEQPSSRWARRVAPLGQLTYSLYMLHPLVQGVVLTGVGVAALKLTGMSMNLFVLAVAVLMLPIAWASLVLFERPARRWLTRTLSVRRVPSRSPAPSELQSDTRSRPEPAMFTPDSRW